MYKLNSSLVCCNLQHRYSVLVEVKVFGSIGEYPYTVTTIVCGDCCNYQVSVKKGRWNMGMLKKIKFQKKTNNNTPTKVDERVHRGSTDLRCFKSDYGPNCHVGCQQTETRMDGGAVKELYVRELEIKNGKIRKLEEELALSKRLNTDLMLNMKSIEQQGNTWRSLSSVGQMTVSANNKSQQSQICWKNLSSQRGTPRTRSQKPHLARTPNLTSKHKQKETAGRGIMPTLMSRKV